MRRLPREACFDQAEKDIVTLTAEQGEVLPWRRTRRRTTRCRWRLRSVSAKVTTVWMDTTSTAVRIDVVKDTMSATVKLAKMLDELDIGQPTADCMPVDGVEILEKAGYQGTCLDVATVPCVELISFLHATAPLHGDNPHAKK